MYAVIIDLIRKKKKEIEYNSRHYNVLSLFKVLNQRFTITVLKIKLIKKKRGKKNKIR
jgi:hypothetical protein